MTRTIDRKTSDGKAEQQHNERPDQPEDWKQPADRGAAMDKYLGDISPKPKGKKS